MKVTFIIRNKTDAFYEGHGDSIKGLNNMTDAEKFAYLRVYQIDVTMKVGNGQFRDKVDLNQLLRQPTSMTYKLEPRRGYKLATFVITPL